MDNPFNFPSVDHLLEGRDYRIVDWSFAQNAPVEKQPPEETVQPNQQNAPAVQNQAPAPQAAPAQAPAAAPPAQPPAAGQAPAAAPPQDGPCKPDERSVFGVCRKIGGTPKDDKDFDSGSKTDEEKNLEAEAKKQGSDVKNNKPVLVGGKKYGWALKGGKSVLVEWGAVAGQKKVGPAQPQVKGASGGPQPLSGKAAKPAVPAPASAQQPPAAPKSDPAAKVAELQQAMKVPGLPESAQKALQNAIDLIGG
jgi:pyruvate dehydrogenase E2 component (dihydrolipoamide acetyltransferase)